MQKPLLIAGWALLAAAAPVAAQIDPYRRQLVQAGYDQSWSGPGPTEAYLFYYFNLPRFPRRGLTMRLAAAPVYMDAELGVKGALGRRGDAGIGLAGGGFADSYAEIRGGHYFREESFIGHSGALSLALYPRLDPDWRMPLHGVLRLSRRLAVYERRGETAPDFSLPPDHGETRLRSGLRLGGSPPLLQPRRALELSVWHEALLRDREGTYGFSQDRRLRRFVQLLWTRAAISWTLERGSRLKASAGTGLSRLADRLSAFRVGGMLPFTSESPLDLPGYYGGELSARRYALFNVSWQRPLDARRRWSARVFAAAANVTFAEGLGQPKPWNSGLGTGLSLASSRRILLVDLDYGYGVDARRSGGRGAHAVGLMLQLDVEAWKRMPSPRRPGPSPSRPEGLEWMLHRLGF